MWRGFTIEGGAVLPGGTPGSTLGGVLQRYAPGPCVVGECACGAGWGGRGGGGDAVLWVRAWGRSHCSQFYNRSLSPRWHPLPCRRCRASPSREDWRVLSTTSDVGDCHAEHFGVWHVGKEHCFLGEGTTPKKNQYLLLVGFLASRGLYFWVEGGGEVCQNAWGLHEELPHGDYPPPPCVTFRLVVVPLRGPGRSPVLPFACCVGSLLSVGRCGRCSCWCRFCVRGAQ